MAPVYLLLILMLSITPRAGRGVRDAAHPLGRLARWGKGDTVTTVHASQQKGTDVLPYDCIVVPRPPWSKQRHRSPSLCVRPRAS